jgi:hypothetical protein
MSRSENNRPADVTFRPAGYGQAMTFKCPECLQNRGIFGRRMRKVTKGAQRGLRTLVCSECAK